MPLLRCTSCAYANAMDAKVCKKCGEELRVPPHLQRCMHCGTLNPAKRTACVWCYRKLGDSSWRRRLPGRAAQGAIAATAVVLLAALGYYAYPRSLPQVAPAAVPSAAAAQEPAAQPQAPAEPPRADRPAETPRPKAAPAAVARQAGETRKGSEREERSSGSCAEGTTALGLCGKTEARQPA